MVVPCLYEAARQSGFIAGLEVSRVVAPQHADVAADAARDDRGTGRDRLDDHIGSAFDGRRVDEQVGGTDGGARKAARKGPRVAIARLALREGAREMAQLRVERRPDVADVDRQPFGNPLAGAE